MGTVASRTLSQPSAARIYDYFLGGAHHFQIDREVALEIQRKAPGIPAMMRANRSFVRRAVRFLTAAGIRQFLDIGSGIPTVGNVHEIAQRAAPESRIVYVDIDPVAIAHSHDILIGNQRATALQADIREPEQIFSSPQLQRLIDLSRPVAVLMAGVLPFVPEAPAAVVRPYRAATAPGSYLVLSHSTLDNQPSEVLEIRELMARTSTRITLRSRREIAAGFQGYRLVEPGLVQTPLWRPDSIHTNGYGVKPAGQYAGIGYKL